MTDTREARYGSAIWHASRADEGTISATGANIVARAVMDVADQETAELRAEVERLELSLENHEHWRSLWEERAEAESARLASVVAKVEALHFAYTLYESCPDYVTGCDDDACTENPHDGEWFHSDQPVGRVCGECNDEDGEPVEFPCPTLAALASVGVSGSADDRREANASQAPDTATPGEADDKAGER